MSLWSRKQLQVVLLPDQVMVSRVAGTLSPRGRHSQALSQQWLVCEPDAQTKPWRAALNALAEALPGYAKEGFGATVVLSNRFMRYALVPWSADLSNEEEEMTFARHCFTRVYGEAAQHWQLRLSAGPARAPRLASALDVELLDELRGTFNSFGIKVQSIQPYLMTAMNALGRRPRGRNVWFAMVEPGNLCLALLQDGRWSRVRSQRLGDDWREELLLALRREMLLADVAGDAAEVYLWRQGVDDPVLPENGKWTVHNYRYGESRADAPVPEMAG